ALYYLQSSLLKLYQKIINNKKIFLEISRKIFYSSSFIFSTSVSTSSLVIFSLPFCILFNVLLACPTGILQNKRILRVFISFKYASALAKLSFAYANTSSRVELYGINFTPGSA